MLINLNLNIKISALLGYWKIFKDAWNTLGVWIYFFHCNFYEI